MKKIFFFLVLVILLFSKGATQNRFLIKVTPITPEETKLLSGSGVKAYAKTADYYLVEATSKNLEYLDGVGLTYMVLDEKPEFSLYYFIWAKPGEKITKYINRIKEKAVIIETD